MKNIFVTGSSGLIGSEVCTFLVHQRYAVHGIEKNQRAVFLGAQGATRWNQQCLVESLPEFTHDEIDTHDWEALLLPIGARRLIPINPTYRRILI
jgi:CDP-paratose 2-epimerase